MTKQQQQQYLVRFQNVTHVLNVDNQEQIVEALSFQTGWPLPRLQVSSIQQEFVSVRIISKIQGGKGGFGTLLKGQSKQAGAKRTTDFGACRDLQGRRLRHVNDEIKLRKWREMQQREKEGLPVGEDEMFNTPSGLYNWHLMVPNWASDSISKKGTKKMQRQLKREMEKYKSESQKAEDEKREKERRYQQSVADYVQQAAQAAEAIAVQDAIQQGLASKKRAQEESAPSDETQEKNSLVTLSGDFVCEEMTKAGWQLQSKSDFGTLALVLDKAPTSDGIYFEVKLVTGGLAQVGWADLTDFRPNTETGDGVGDVGSSYAVDGSRSLKFYKGTEQAYGESWKAGDVLGCIYNLAKGEIVFSINGKDCGRAFEVHGKRPLVPALSCNEGEILELHVHPTQIKYQPSDCIPVYDLLTTDSRLVEGSSKIADSKKDETTDTKEELPPQRKKPKVTKPAPVQAEPLDLDKFSSQSELEELGLDRLKGALMALGVKCGGTLQERAARLFLLKGLERKDYPNKVRAKNFVL